jgi:hypothetical protein
VSMVAMGLLLNVSRRGREAQVSANAP